MRVRLSVPSPNCRPVCRTLVRQFGDKGTLAESKCSCGLCLANAFESPLQIWKAFARHRTRSCRARDLRACAFPDSGSHLGVECHAEAVSSSPRTDPRY